MKRNLLLFALILMVSQAFGQEYYAIKRIGADKGYIWNTTAYSYTQAIGSNSTDVLVSETLPFSWSLYGKSFTSLKVSRNGYVTFDPNETVSNPTNGSLPSTSAPKSAIFAFWTALTTSNTGFNPNGVAPQVRVYTMGTSPNRQYGIEWVFASLSGQTATSYYTIFTLRLFEAGGFDVIHEYSAAAANGIFKATIGVNNSDGTKGYMYPGSPNLDGQAFNAGTGDPSLATKFDFQFGVQPLTDGANLYTYLKENVKSTDATAISGIFANYGSAAITSMNLNYQIGSGSVQTQSLDLSANPIGASGGTYVYTHSTPWINGTVGQVNKVKIWASNINGKKDEVPANDTLHTTIMANNGAFPTTKRVLIEEGSGAWCGFCPDGHRILKGMIATYNTAISTQLVGLVLHNGDGLTNNGDSVNQVFQVGYPFGTVDRYKFATEAGVGISRNNWETDFTTKLTQASPADVTIINKSWNPTTRQITFTVKAVFGDYWQGDIRFNGYVVEDNVRGNSTTSPSIFWFTQHNYYSKNDPSYHGAGGAGHPLYNEPDTLYGYLHNHAALKLIGGSWGNGGIVKNGLAAPGDVYTRTYTYTLPATTTYTGIGTNKGDALYSTVSGQGYYKPNDIKLVGYIYHYNNDGTKMEVLNADETPLIGWSAGIKPEDAKISSNIYPNPTNGVTTVNFNMPQAGNASIEVINAVGQRVELVKEGNFAAGTQNVELDATNYSNGVYFVKISSGDITSTQRLVVVK